MEREYQENLAKNKGKRWVSLEGLVTGMVMISLVPITPICTALSLQTIAVNTCFTKPVAIFSKPIERKQEGRG